MEIDRAAPGFELPALSGGNVALQQFRGRIVLLDFWATWCGPCRISMPVMEKIQNEYPGDVSLLAINLQEPRELVESYIRRQNIRSTVLLDEDGEVGRVYQSHSIPMHVLIDREGIVRHVQIGFSPRVADDLRRQIEKLRSY
jgi:thiol-disulfide isomerase/thioredoxin